jgi:hypothetical protein
MRCAMTNGKRYFNKPLRVPRSIPAGRILAHNHVQHTVDMGYGVNGFRCWTWPKDKVPRNFKRCKCGWSGLPHYRLRGEDKRQDALGDRCNKQLRW